jgi:cytochrome c-type biogenesis protein
MTTIVVGFFAGTLSALSPCVLPMIPIVVASAFQRHAHGPLAVAGGFVLASTATGLAFASLGFAAGVDRETARAAAAVVMAAAGLVLIIPALQNWFASLVTPVSAGATALTAHLPSGLLGQFVLGALLGIVWTPCTGPALAAAVSLATRSESVVRAGSVMLAFGTGAAIPIVVVAYGSRHAFLRRSDALSSAAAWGKPLLGSVLIAIGILTWTGADKTIEAWMVDRMPPWLLDLTTRL